MKTLRLIGMAFLVVMVFGLAFSASARPKHFMLGSKFALLDSLNPIYRPYYHAQAQIGFNTVICDNPADTSHVIWPGEFCLTYHPFENIFAQFYRFQCEAIETVVTYRPSDSLGYIDTIRTPQKINWPTACDINAACTDTNGNLLPDSMKGPYFRFGTGKGRTILEDNLPDTSQAKAFLDSIDHSSDLQSYAHSAALYLSPARDTAGFITDSGLVLSHVWGGGMNESGHNPPYTWGHKSGMFICKKSTGDRGPVWVGSGAGRYLNMFAALRWKQLGPYSGSTTDSVLKMTIKLYQRAQDTSHTIDTIKTFSIKLPGDSLTATTFPQPYRMLSLSNMHWGVMQRELPTELADTAKSLDGSWTFDIEIRYFGKCSLALDEVQMWDSLYDSQRTSLNSCTRSGEADGFHPESVKNLALPTT